MSNTLAHNVGVIFGTAATDARSSEPVAESKTSDSEAPVGYRWMSKRWRVLPDGTRDYAAFHGKTAFSVLLPVSSRLHSPKR